MVANNEIGAIRLIPIEHRDAGISISGVSVKKKLVEPKAAGPLSRMPRPKAKKKHAKNGAPRFPPEVEEAIRIHGHENILRSFVAALSSLQKSISTLESELAVAFDSQPRDQSPRYERARYIYTLTAISTFLKNIGTVSYQEQFYRLAVALDDLNRGSVDPLLEPIKTGGTKKLNASWAWCARAHISVGIFALLKAGLKRREAAQKAANEFPKINELAGLIRQTPSSTATKILSWFDDFNKGTRTKIKNQQALAIFGSGQQEIEKLPKDDERLHKLANRMFALAVKSVRD
jgi:hypothetical protein